MWTYQPEPAHELRTVDDGLLIRTTVCGVIRGTVQPECDIASFRAYGHKSTAIQRYGGIGMLRYSDAVCGGTGLQRYSDAGIQCMVV